MLCGLKAKKLFGSAVACVCECVRQHSSGPLVRTTPESKTNWTTRWPLGTLGSEQVKCPKSWTPRGGQGLCVYLSLFKFTNVSEFTSILISPLTVNAQPEQQGPGVECWPWFCLWGASMFSSWFFFVKKEVAPVFCESNHITSYFLIKLHKNKTIIHVHVFQKDWYLV